MPLPPSEVDRLRRRPLRKQQQQRQREPHQKDQEHCHHQKQQQRQQQQHPPTEESRMSEVLKNATSQTAWMDNFDVTSLHKSCYVCGDRFLGLHSLVRCDLNQTEFAKPHQTNTALASPAGTSERIHPPGKLKASSPVPRRDARSHYRADSSCTNT